ncbi:MAG: right-handed parallel beta-helix repeat-containing protein [Bacteroidales bacterium]|nr:right-handed parallel beta-helix repeat-containing protein [Bacteroidales bacterium]
MKHHFYSFRMKVVMLSLMAIFLAMTSSAQITTYPYFENFDGASTWTSGGTGSTWALGVPAMTTINSAYSAPNVWATNLTGNYANSELSWIQSPEFSFVGLTAPVVEFKMWYVTQNVYTDGASLQYSLDQGTTWAHVGAEYGSILPDVNATNWYNENTIAGLEYKNGWAGNSGGWITGKYILNSPTVTNLANQASVTFRFLFGSNASTQNEGIAIDNFSVYQQPNTDIGIISLYSIESVCIGLNDVYAIVQNFGLNTITTFNANWEVNSVSQTGYLYSGSLATNATDTIYLGQYNFLQGTTYNVTASTANPNGTIDQNTFNDSYTITGLTTSLSGAYTVGTGADYATIDAAITALQNIGVCAPVIMNILPGTYTGNYSIGAVPGTNAVNTVTFTSSTGIATDVVLTYAAAGSTDYWTWRFNNTSYIILDKVTVVGTGATYARAVEFINAASFCTVSNCIINIPVGTSSYFVGVYANTTLENNITIANNIINNGYYGVYVRGASSSSYESNTVITGNTFNNPYYYGINLAYNNFPVISNNIININSASSTTYGIYNYYTIDAIIDGNTVTNSSASGTGYGIYSAYSDGAQKILNNRITMTNNGTVYALYDYYCDASPGNEALVANNFVYQGVGTGTAYGLYMYYSTYQNVYFNSIHITGGSSTAGKGMYFYSASTTASSIRVANNNVVNSGGGYAADILAASVTANYVSYSDYNNIYATGPVLVRWGATDMATLAAFQTATGSNANSVSVDPVFVSPTDLHTSNATLNAAAEPYASVTTDIDGELRDATTPDIGADEFTPAQNDAGVSAFVGINTVCPGTSDVIVSVGNYGLAILNTVQIHWTVNGVAQPVINATNLNLASGSMTDVTLGTFNFVAGTVYNLSAYTTLPNGSSDANHINDSTFVTGMETSLSGTYTVGATGNYLTIQDAVNALSSHGICGPVVINVEPGTYTGQATIGVINGSSATNTVLIQSSTGITNDVIVQYAGTASTDNWVLAFNGCDYVTVKTMTFLSTTSSTYGRVVMFDLGANYNTLDSCRVVSIVGTSSNASGIYSTTTGVDNFNTISNCSIENGYYGIYFYGSSSAMEDGNKFINNSITGFYYYGIYSGYSLNIQTIGNLIANGSNSSTNYALRYYYNDGQSIITGNNIIGTNTSTFYGLYYYYCDPDTSAPSLIANNFISYQGGTTATAYGLYVYNSMATQIYNNSVNILTGSATASAAAYYFYTTGTTYANTAIYWLDSKNNNFVNTGSGYSYLINEGVYQLGSMTSDHNNLYVSGTNLTKVGTVNQTTLTAWQNYYPGDVKNVNPGYVSSSDLHTNSGDLDGFGVPLAEVATDIDGEARDASTPDIGADEYTPASFDCGVVNILNLSGVCPGTIPVEVVIQNFGLDTLTTAWIHWTINGVAQTTYIWTGSIAPLETDTALVGSYTFTSGTFYTVEAHTSHPNNGSDGNAQNDAYTTPGFETAMFGTYTVGATGDFLTITEAAQALMVNGICDDVIISITPGTYNESVMLNDVVGVGPNATITFQSSTGVNTDVIVTFTGTSAINYVFQITSADYVTIQNMTLTNTASATYGKVFSLTGGSDHITINNNLINSITGSSSSAAGIYATGLNNYLTISNNTIKYGYYGIYAYGSSSALNEGTQILNNNVTDFYYYGIYAYYHNNARLEGNFVETAAASTSTTVYVLTAGYCDGESVIANNDVRDARSSSTVYGLRVYYCDAPSMAQATLVYNNRVSITGTKTSVYAFYIYYSAYAKCYYNSVNVTTGTSTCRAAYLYSSTTGVYNTVMKNNSIVANVNAAAFSIYYYGPATGLTSDHNNYYNNGTNFGYNNANVITQASWQAVYPGDVISTGSAYVSNTNLHSLSAMLDGQGTPILEVTVDMDGDVRNTLTPDIGADEFELLAYDLELANVYTLGEIPQEAGDNHVMVARVINAGTQTQYNKTITLQITGANTQTVTANIDTIVGGAIKYINFQPYTLTNLGWNTLNVSIESDQNNNNNSLTLPQLATTNVMTFADTTVSTGNGGNNDADGHIYWNKYYINGLKSVTQVTAYITGDANNVGNTVYGAVMDMNNNLLGITNPHMIAANELDTYITMTFADPSGLTFANEYAYVGFVQTPTVASAYFPIGYQDEIPMRPETYYYSSNMNGSGFTLYTNNRRWMIKAVLEDPAPYNAAVIAVVAPVSETCGLGNENIIATTLNYGSDTITTYTMSYQVNGGSIVTENVIATLIPGATYNYTFNQAYNFVAPTADSTFTIKVWATLAGDTLHANDTILVAVNSLYVPIAPVANIGTTIFGTNGTFSASAADTIAWFMDPQGLVSLGFGDSITYGPLFDTTTIYASAIIPSGTVALTEFMIGDPDFIEIQNISSGQIDATGWVVAVSNSYTDINSVNANLWNLGVMPAGQVLYKSDSSTDNYWGSNLFWNPGAVPSYRGWAIILDNLGNIVDFANWGWTDAELATFSAAINGFTVNFASAWSGGYINASTNYLTRTNYDTDTPGDWLVSAAGNIGFANPTLAITSSTGSGCASDLVPVTVNVTNIPINDAGVSVIISPQSGFELGMETICVEIQNLGSVAAVNFPITVSVDNGFQLTDYVTTPLAAGSTAQFCFNFPVDLTPFGTYELCVYTQFAGDGYAANDTLCTTIINDSSMCASYATSTSYEEIIEVGFAGYVNNTGPAYGATYSNFTGLGPVADLIPGMTYPLHITSYFAPGYTTIYTCYAKVYADWNHDGVFSETTELIYGALTNSNSTINGTFTVPGNAYIGVVNLRVVMEETSAAANVSACGTYSWGETEDYKVNIQAPSPWDVATMAITQPSGTLIQGQISPVVATVYNIGTETITSLVIEYTINGGAPVSYNWSGSLASFSNTSVTLPSFVIPGGNYTICVTSILANDANASNNSYCGTYFALPQFDLEMTAILAPESGCDYNYQDVTVTFTNLGDTITDPIQLGYQLNTMSNPHIENFTGVILPGAVITYTFNSPVNLTVFIDTDFELTAFTSYIEDPIHLNDSIMIEVGSYVSPPAPSANSLYVWSGQSATFNVNNPDTNLVYSWFMADTTFLDFGNSISTPPLYDTATYYLGASSGGGSGSLTTAYNSNNGLASIMFSVQALSGNITIESFDINIDGTTPVEVFYHAGGFLGAESNQALWTLLGSLPSVTSNGANVPTPLAIGGLMIPAGETYGILITTTNSGMNYTTLTVPETYTDGNITLVTGAGVPNPLSTTINYPRGFNGTVYYSSGNGCVSELTEVNAYVQYADYDAAVVGLISPESGSFLSSDSVIVAIYNNGLNPISNFPMNYTVNGTNMVSQTYAGTIMPGDTAYFTFSTLVNLSVFGSYDICVTANVANDGLTSNDTYCGNVINYNGSGLNCAEAFPYGTINDPSQNSATTFAYDSEWWSFEVPSGLSYDNVVISLCGSGFDTYLYYYTACNTAPASSNDNSCGTASQISLGTTALTAGIYYVKVSGASTNFGTYTLSITGNLIPKFIVNLTAYAADCNGTATGAITSNILQGPTGSSATLPVTYHWSNNASTEDITNIAAGTYFVSVTDATGWTEVVQATVTEPSEIVITTDSVSHNTVIGGHIGSIGITVTGGAGSYTYLWGNGATTQDLTDLYAGIYALTVTDANGCQESISIPVNSPSPWTATPTSISHIIVIPQNTLITLDLLNLSPGSFVGVFYDSSGTLACGGWAYWSGMATTLTAYGASAGQENGFNPNETFYWKVYDAALGVQYPGTATYNVPQYPNNSSFAPGGLSGLTKIEAFSIITQTIPLPEGWSIWSTYISPTNPNIQVVMAEIAPCPPGVSKVVIVKNGAGAIYWPAYCLNMIGNVIVGQGYQVKVANSGQGTSFGVTGLKLSPNTQFTIPAGWSFIAYLKDQPASVVTMLAAIAPQGNPAGCTQIVKNGAGQIFWPLYSLVTFPNGLMYPGQGYQLKNNCSALTFSYPGTKSEDLNFTEAATPSHFGSTVNTGNNMTLGIPEDAWISKPNYGDEIGVFNAENQLIGASVYEEGFTAITIWGKEIINPEEKGSIGSPFSIKLYNTTTNQESTLTVDSWLEGEAVYAENGIAVVEKFAPSLMMADEWFVGQNNPNPFNSSTTIPVYAPVENYVEITLYNTLGEMIQVIYQGNLKAGNHEIKVNAERLPAGNYYYKFTSDSFACTKYMTIQ